METLLKEYKQQSQSSQEDKKLIDILQKKVQTLELEGKNNISEAQIERSRLIALNEALEKEN